MHKMLLLFIFLASFFVYGCQESEKSSLKVLSQNGMQVVISGGDGQFPEFLVGKWQSDKHGWEFNFELNGKISSAVVTMGRTRMEPGKIRLVPMRMGKKGEFVPGDWEVYYDHEGRELIVKIVIKHFFMEMGDDVLEGKSEDLFVGNISEDGRTWEVAWKSFPDYVAHFPDKSDFKMAADPEWGVDYTITFSKIIPEIEK